MITVLVVEDHAVVRHGLRFLLEQEDDISVIAEAVGGSAALAAARAHQPDVVLLDLFIPPPDGLTILPVLRAEHPSTAVVVLTSSGDDEHVIAAIRAGALSYLHKTAEAGEITAAVRAAAAGQGILTPATASLLRHRRTTPAPRLDLLSPREREVLAELSRGRSNRESPARSASPKTPSKPTSPGSSANSVQPTAPKQPSSACSTNSSPSTQRSTDPARTGAVTGVTRHAKRGTSSRPQAYRAASRDPSPLSFLLVLPARVRALDTRDGDPHRCVTRRPPPDCPA